MLFRSGLDVEWTNNIDVPGTLDVTGAATFDAAVTIQGDLTVNGTTTTIDTQNLIVEDKNIVVGQVTSPTDVTADGGGITLKGTTDKTIKVVTTGDRRRGLRCHWSRISTTRSAGASSVPAER